MKNEIEFIVGPDGIRDVAQTRQVALWAKDHGIRDLRGGVIKPRSSPTNKDGTPAWLGIGFEHGLPIIMEALCGFNGSFTVEVWNTDHVKTIDEVTKSSGTTFHKQIGARTGPGNKIKEIGDEMIMDPKQSKLVIKNQMEAGSQTFINRVLWGQASLDTGRLQAVARGHAPGNDIFRNTPNLNEALEVRNKFSNLEIVVDLSHTAGISPERVELFAREMVEFHNQVLAETGVILVNKIMIEVDPNPEDALCDKDQLLDLTTASALIENIRKTIRMEA